MNTWIQKDSYALLSSFIFEGSALSYNLHINCMPVLSVEHSDNKHCITADPQTGKNKILRILLVQPVEKLQQETQSVFVK